MGEGLALYMLDHGEWRTVALPRGAATAQGDKLVFSDRSLMFFDGQEITQVRDWDADSFSVSLPRGGALAMALVMTEGDKAAYFMNGTTLTRSPLFETATAKRHRLDTVTCRRSRANVLLGRLGGSACSAMLRAFRGLVPECS